MTVNAVDCTGLSPSSIANLVKNGVKTVGRYLSHSTWKGLSLGEVANIKAAGLQIFSIYESNPTKASYFVTGKGKSDALDAMALAKAVGQPEGTAIYFTVDFDCQGADFPKILAYFKEIKANLVGFKVGAYGSFTVLNYLHQNNVADYWFQTVAWSNHQVCSFLNIYQSQCDTKVAGVPVDIDQLMTSDIGAWGQQQIKHEAVSPAKPVTPNVTQPLYGVVIVNKPKDYAVNTYSQPNLNTNNGQVNGQDPFVVYSEDNGFYCIGANSWIPKQYCTYKPYIATIDYDPNYSVNTYSSPGGSFSGQVQGGKAFKAYGEKDGFIAIGNDCWVDKNYVKLSY